MGGAGETAGAGFARALAEKDREAMLGLLDEQIEFRALTPKRAWEADDPASVLEIVFGSWFEDGDRIEALEDLETEPMADRGRLRYRVAVSNDEGSFVVEQQGYFTERDGRIDWLRLVCSGYRPR